MAIIPADFLALAFWLGEWSVAALISSVGSVEGEGESITAAPEDWETLGLWLFACGISVEVALDRMEALVPFALVFRESSGKLKIALANVSSA